MVGSALLYNYLRLRSLNYALQYGALLNLSRLLPWGKRHADSTLGEGQPYIKDSLLKLLREDADNIERGLYPISVLTPESPLEHARRIPSLLVDAFAMQWKKKRGEVEQFSKT